MADAWYNLGQAIGRAFAPFHKLAPDLWAGFGVAAGDLVKGFMGSTSGIRTAVKPMITNLMPDIFGEATKALGSASPPEEVKKAVEEMIKALMKTVEEEAKTEGESVPSMSALQIRQGALTGGIITMYAVTHAISMALDASHPMKDWGFKTAIMDILFQFDMGKVIGPMIQAPIWASVVAPLRLQMAAKYPYDVPGSGILPYMRHKGILPDAEYKTNMKYHALDPGWSDKILANVARFPSFSELRIMMHRGKITIAQAKAALQKSMMSSDYIDGFEASIPSIPGVSDLVRFAVREAYPDADTFEQHYAKMTSWIKQIGYSKYFADAFWGAHWIIPSTGQADDLLHRGEISTSEHTSLYILNDIRPKDIPNLRKLTWALPGRIDARWLFRWGKIDLTGLRDLLIKSGLDPSYADRVAEATAKNQYLTHINREIGNSKTSFVKGYIVESTLKSDLSSLGLRSEMVDYHISDAKADRVRGIKDDQLRTLRTQFARGALKLADVIEAVNSIIVDKSAREAWILALPTAKQVMVVEETYATEVNRLVTNAKYDYVRGYTKKTAMVTRFKLLDLPDEIIEFHVLDADEDRARASKDKRLKVIEEAYIDELMDWSQVKDMAEEIIIDSTMYDIFLDEVWLNKHKAVRVAASE